MFQDVVDADVPPTTSARHRILLKEVPVAVKLIKRHTKRRNRHLPTETATNATFSVLSRFPPMLHERPFKGRKEQGPNDQNGWANQEHLYQHIRDETRPNGKGGREPAHKRDDEVVIEINGVTHPPDDDDPTARQHSGKAFSSESTHISTENENGEQEVR